MHPLLHLEHSIEHGEFQAMLYEALTSVRRYIKRSLEAVGVRICAYKRVTFKSFWDQKPSLLKDRGTNPGGRLEHIYCNAGSNFSGQSAKEADQELKREVCSSNRSSVLSFSDKVDKLFARTFLDK